MDNHEYLFYVINKKFAFDPKSNLIKYKKTITNLLDEFCDYDYKLIDFTPKYFIVETSTKLLSYEFNSGKNNYISDDEIFLKNLYKLIPELKDNLVYANIFQPYSSRKKCYISTDSLDLDVKAKFAKTITAKFLYRGEEVYNTPSKIYHHLNSGKYYYYIGDDIYYDYENGDESCCYIDFYDVKLGKKGAVYQKGYVNNLYLIHELDDKYSKVYEAPYFFDKESEIQFIKKVTKLSYKILIDDIWYNVYRDSCIYEGMLDSWYEIQHFPSYDDAPDVVVTGYHGYGKYCRYGIMYEGNFYKGKYHGFGILKNTETHHIIYEGKFAQGKYDGLGTLYDENGNKVYSGEWEYGKRNGIGTEFDMDGSIKYSGIWYYDMTEEDYKKSQEYY